MANAILRQPEVQNRLGVSSSTFEFRNLGICSSAARILELRKQGFDIATTWQHEKDHADTTHRIGIYSLINEKGAQV